MARLKNTDGTLPGWGGEGGMRKAERQRDKEKVLWIQQ